MSWASRRQGQYLFGLFLFLGVIAFIIVYPILTKPATCSDGKQNGAERGVDCGGVCQRICTADAAEPRILWQRAFPVSNSTYNLVALVENTNKDAAVATIAYEFRIYDTNNLLIGRRQGTTFIPPSQPFAVFEPRFDAGQSEIRSVQFSFTSPFMWVKKLPTPEIIPSIDNVVYSTDTNSPSMTAHIRNDSAYDLPAFDVIAILYDSNHIAINVSKTHKEGLASNGNELLLFTWPEPFGADPVAQDILPLINPFTISL